MKKRTLFALAFISLIAIQSCKKTETVVEEYNPPSPTLYGTWKAINEDPTNNSSLYYVFDKSNNFASTLEEDEYGFRESNSYAFSATNKQVSLGGGLLNYTVNGDTLKMKYSSTQSSLFLRVASPTFTPENWLKSISVIQKTAAVNSLPTNISFGVNGDFLYFSQYVNGYKVFKYNTLNNTKVDSNTVSSNCCVYYKGGKVYYGKYANDKLFKTTELDNATNQNVSTNSIYYPVSISINGNSNTIYTLDYNKKLLAGTDGGAFSELFDFSSYNISMVQYYGNDEFLILKNYSLFKVKISPTFSVTTSYNGIPNFSISSIATNGVDTWVYGRENSSNKFKFIKINLN